MAVDPIVPDPRLGSAPAPLQPAGIPAGFLFSQSSLQDYNDCRRRFLLRYLLRLAWPAVESEPVLENEAYMQQGQRFHQLAQQSFTGVPVELLRAQIHDDELLGWWDAFVTFSRDLRGLPLALPEIGLSAPFGGFRLLAKLDLLTAADGKFTIYDWKTSRKRPRPRWLADRLQTRVYPFLLVRAGSALNGGQPISPESIEMIYWFPAFPDQPERFTYTEKQYNDDQANLTGLLSEIERRALALPPILPGPGMAPLALSTEMLAAMDAGFPRTPVEQRCAYCVYRSLCDRGESAGLLDYLDQDAEPPEVDVQIDLEQIAEIAF